MDGRGHPTIAVLAQVPTLDHTVVFKYPKYSAPEAFAGSEGHATSSCEARDCYVLGFMFYELLAGKTRFAEQFSALESGPASGWFKWHSNKLLKAVPLERLTPRTGASISGLIGGMIEKDPEKRIRTISKALDLMPSEDPTVLIRPAHAKANSAPIAEETTARMAVPRDAQSDKEEAPRKSLWIQQALFAGLLVVLAAAVLLFRELTPKTNKAVSGSAVKGVTSDPKAPVSHAQEDAKASGPVAPPSEVRIVSDIKNAVASLDGRDLGAVVSGTPMGQAFGIGQHSLRISAGGDSYLDIEFEAGPDSVVTLREAPGVKGLRSIVLVSNADGARLFVYPPAHAAVSGAPLRRVPKRGLAIPNDAISSIRFDDDPQNEVPLGAAKAAPLTVFVSEDGKSAPAENSTAGVNEGMNLQVDSAPAGVEVLIDQTAVGVTDGSGPFKTKTSAGKHTITFRKENFEDLSVVKEMGAVGSLRMAWQALKPLGKLTFAGSPASAHINLQGESEPRGHECLNAQPCYLRSGNYDLSIRAEGFKPVAGKLVVDAGDNKSYPYQLEALPKVTKARVSSLPAELFADGQNWTVDGDGWWVHAEPGYSFLRSGLGTYIFDIDRPVRTLGSKRVSFVADFLSVNHRIVYTLDNHNLRRRVHAPELDLSDQVVAHEIPPNEVFRLRVELKPDRIVIHNGAGKVLDDLTLAGSSGGRFGFSGKVRLKAYQTQEQPQ